VKTQKKTEFGDVTPVQRVRDGKRERYCIVTGLWLPVGVSWSDHYQKFRAWKDVGRKQMRHGLFDRAEKAIEARRAWDIEFRNVSSKRVELSVQNGESGYQGKLAQLPKEQNRSLMLRRFRRLLRTAHRVMEEAPPTRTNPISASRRAVLGDLVGLMMADVEFFVDCGMLKADDIQRAMQREARRLAGEPLAGDEAA